MATDETKAREEAKKVADAAETAMRVLDPLLDRIAADAAE